MSDGRGADLIVWPETAVPTRINERPVLVDWVRSVPTRLGCTLLAGAAEAGPGGLTYNTLWGYDARGRAIGRYRKQQLVIFGEYVPWRDTLTFLKRYPIRDFDYSPGQEDVLIPVKGCGVAPMICFESIFPDISRRLVREGATVLVVATSDSWVGAAPAELWQHVQASPFRAVENGRWLIRAASTGVTCLISPSGRITEEAPIGVVASVRGFVWPRQGMTLYTQAGDWPLVALVSFLLLAGVRNLRPFGARRRSAA
jgi:apolipoprotein N-acyltransferase